MRAGGTGPTEQIRTTMPQPCPDYGLTPFQFSFSAVAFMFFFSSSFSAVPRGLTLLCYGAYGDCSPPLFYFTLAPAGELFYRTQKHSCHRRRSVPWSTITLKRPPPNKIWRGPARLLHRSPICSLRAELGPRVGSPSQFWGNGWGGEGGNGWPFAAWFMWVL